MTQSGVIFFALLLAFIIFITQKGELPTYLGLLLLSPQGGAGGLSTGGTASTAGLTRVIITGGEIASGM